MFKTKLRNFLPGSENFGSLSQHSIPPSYSSNNLISLMDFTLPLLANLVSVRLTSSSSIALGVDND